MRDLNQLLRHPPIGVQVSASNPDVAVFRRKVLRRVAAQFRAGVGTTGSQTITFWAHNPSPRLRWALSVAFEYPTGEDYTAGSTSGTWSLQAMRRSSQGGRQSSLNSIFTGRAVPDGYELDSAVKDIKGSIVLAETAVVASSSCDLVVECSWEPAEIIDGETDRLIAEADVTVSLGANGQPIVLST